MSSTFITRAHLTILFFILFFSIPALSERKTSQRSLRTTITGTLQLTAVDYFQRGEFSRGDTKLFMLTKKGRILIDSPQSLLSKLQGGTQITLRGQLNKRRKTLRARQVIGRNSVPEITPDIVSVSPPISNPRIPPSINGEKKVLALIGSFSDRPAPCSKAEVETALTKGECRPPTDSEGCHPTKRVIEETSGGRASVNAEVIDGINLGIPFSTYACSLDQLSTIADAFKTAIQNRSIDITKYDHVAYIFPLNLSNPDCNYAGVADIGGSETWIHVCNSYTLTHELGHNWGMFHSQSVSGRDPEYGDLSDYMGKYIRHLNAPHLIELGWIKESDVQEAKSSGEYTISPLYGTNPLPNRPRIVRVDLPSLEKSILLSYRRDFGFFQDTNPFFYNVLNIHRFRVRRYTNSIERNPVFLQGLNVGESFSDSESGVQVIVTELTPDRVKFTLNGTCLQRAPKVTVLQTSPGTSLPLNFDVAIRNNDSFCAPTSFQLSGEVPAGMGISSLPSTVYLGSGVEQKVGVRVSSTGPTPQNGVYSLLIRSRSNVGAGYESLGSVSFSITNSSGISVAPQMYPSGIVNGASYEPNAFAPGSLFSVFGSNLSGTTNLCDPTTSQCGTQLKWVNDVRVPLLFASPYLLNGQIPYVAQSSSTQFLRTSTTQGESKVAVEVSSVAPALFGSDGSPHGIAVAEEKLSRQPITQERPAKIGETLYLYGTGGGVSSPAGIDGVAPKDATNVLVKRSQVFITLPSSQPPIELRLPLALGVKAPGQVGVDRYEFKIPPLPFGRATADQLLGAKIKVCTIESEELTSVRCSNELKFPIKK